MQRSCMAIWCWISLVGLAVAGCSAPTGGPGPDDQINEFEDHCRLEVIGAAERTMAQDEQAELQVRYVHENGAFIVGEVVDFVLEGEGAGASVSASSATTDDFGVATVIVRAGTPARFSIVASAPLAEQPASVSFEVVEPRFGTVDYSVTYSGERRVRQVEVGLFAGSSCSDLERRVPTPTQFQTTRLGASASFENVETHVEVALFGVGIDPNGFVAADGCVDVTVEGTGATVEIALGDIPEIFGGDFSVVETFDVTAGMDPTLDALLDAMTGLSNDPARYIVDAVAESDASPDWLRSALDSDIVRAMVATTLRDAISGVETPEYLTDVLSLGAEVDAAFSGMSLRGVLELGEPDEFGTADARHLLTSLEVPVGDDVVSQRLDASADFRMPSAEAVTIPEHEMAVDFGLLTQTVLHDILLPRLPGEPHSMREFLGQLYDCEEIATWLAGDESLAALLANAACNVGSDLLADRMEDYLLHLVEYNVLHLDGAAKLADTDGDYDHETIREGTLNARWTGESGEITFTGTLQGSLPDDTAGRAHPVHDKLNELL